MFTPKSLASCLLLGRSHIVRDRQHLVKNAESLVEFVAGDSERRADQNVALMDTDEEPSFQRRLCQARGSWRGLPRHGVGKERLARLSITHQLDRPKETEAADVTD